MPGVHCPAAVGHHCAADGYEEGGTSSREEVQEKFETLRMEREDVRPATPEPPPFVVNDLVHIRPEFWRAFGIGASLRCACLRLTNYHRDRLGVDCIG